MGSLYEEEEQLVRKALVASGTHPLLHFPPSHEMGLSNRTQQVLLCKCVCVVQEGSEPSLTEHFELFILPLRRALCHLWLPQAV